MQAGLMDELLPPYTTVQTEVLQRILDVTQARGNALNQVDQGLSAIRELEVQRKKALESQKWKEAERLDQRIKDSKAMVSAGRQRVKASLDLKRILHNYFANTEVATGALNQFTFLDKKERAGSEVWEAFFQDQFAQTKSDALDRAMVLTPDEVLEDLNLVAKATTKYLKWDGPLAVKYLEDLSTYCAAGRGASRLAMFEKRYRATLEGRIRRLARPELRPDFKAPQGTEQFVEKIKEDQQRAVRNLRRIWELRPVKEGEDREALFKTWSESAVTASYEKNPEFEKVIWSEKGLPSAAVVCSSLEANSLALKTEIQKRIDDKKDAESELQKKYWDTVQVSSDIFFAYESRFSPIVISASEVRWFRNPPTSVVPVAYANAETEKDAGDKEKTVPVFTNDLNVASVLTRFLSLPGLSNAELKTILETSKDTRLVQTLGWMGNKDTVQARLQWLNDLNLEQRHSIYRVIQNYLYQAVIFGLEKIKGVDIIGSKSVGVPGYDDWKKELLRGLSFWVYLKGRTRQALSEDKELPAYFAQFTNRIYSLFVSHLPFRLQGDRFQRVGTEKLEPAATAIAGFAKLTPLQKMSVIEDIEHLVSVEQDLNMLDAMTERSKILVDRSDLGLRTEKLDLPAIRIFEKEFLEVQALTPPSIRVTDQAYGQFITFYIDNFFYRPSADVPQMESWKSYCRIQTTLGKACGLAENSFSIAWSDTGLLGEEGTTAKDFKAWWESLKANPEAQQEFKKQQTKPKPEDAKKETKDRKHLWDLYDTLAKTEATTDTHVGVVAQVQGLLELYDSNAKALPIPQTYPYFLALMNWNSRHYGKEPNTKLNVYLGPPTDKHLAKLTDDIAAILKLDPRNFARWENLFKSGEDGAERYWILMAESRRDLNVGVGQRRFLKTETQAPYVDAPSRLRRDYAYRPIPWWLTDKRHIFNSPEGEFSLSSVASFSMQDLAAYRAIDKTKQRPLYKQMVAVSLEMMGERDVVEKNPVKRDRVKTILARDSQWDGHTFGVMPAMEEPRKKEIQRRLKVHGVTLDDNQVSTLVQARERFVDFMRTLSELNTMYPFESAKESRAAFVVNIERAALRYAEQLQWGGEIPDFRNTRSDVLAKVANWAGYLTYRDVFRDRTKEEREKLGNALKVIDSFYTELVQTVEVQKGLVVVSDNIRTNLELLCDSGDLRSVRNEEDFKKYEDRIKNSHLAFYDNIIELVHFDGAYIPPGKETDAEKTRQLLVELAQKQTALRDTLDTVNHVISWSVGIGVLVFLFGRSQPALSRMVMNSRTTQVAMLALTLALGTSFVVLEGEQFYQDFFGRPEEVEMLKSLAYSVSLAETEPLISDQMVNYIERADRQVYQDQRSKLRWALRIWGLMMGWQLLTPAAKLLRGGARWVLQLRNPMRPANMRYAAHARTLQLPPSKEPFNRVVEMGPQKTRERIDDLLEDVMKAKRNADGSFSPDRKTLQALQRDIERQLENETRALGLNSDLKPILQDGMDNGLQRYVSRERARLMPRLEFLKAVQKRLAEEGKITTTEIVLLLGPEGDPFIRHTPFLWSLLAIPAPYPGKDLKQLQKLYRIAQAHLDVFAIHQPQLLKTLAHLVRANGAKGSIELGELFNPYRAKNFQVDMPKDVRNLCDNIFKAAEKSAKAYVNDMASWGGFESGAEMEVARYRMIREVFLEVLDGQTIRNGVKPIVERFGPEVTEVSATLGPKRLRRYVNSYLSNHGLALEAENELRIKTINAFGQWESWNKEFMPFLENYAARMSKELGEPVLPEDVIRWMLDKSHRYHYLTVKKGPKTEPASPTEEIFLDPAEHSAGVTFVPSDERNIFQIATRLRKIMRPWVPNERLVTAVARGDYRQMARSLVYFEKAQLEAIASGKPKTPKSDDELPIEEITPLEPPPVKKPEPKKSPLSDLPPSAPPTGPRLSFLKTNNPINRLPEDLQASKALLEDLLLRKQSAFEIQSELGELRLTNQLSAQDVSAYRIAIEHLRVMELAELGATTAKGQEALFSELSELYLKDLHALAKSEMSRAEALEILGLSRAGWPNMADIKAAAEKQIGSKKHEGTVNEALQFFVKLYGAGDVPQMNSIEHLAQVLNIPVPCMPSDSVARAALNSWKEFTPAFHGSFAEKAIFKRVETAARDMYGRLYMSKMDASISDAMKCLGLPGNSTPEAMIARTVELETSIRRYSSHSRSLDRVQQALQILTNFRNYPTHIAKGSFDAHYPLVDIYWHFDPIFQDGVARLRLSKEQVVNPAIENGIEPFRLHVLRNLAKRKQFQLLDKQLEEMGRLMHAVMVLRNTEAAGAANGPKLQQLTELLMNTMVTKRPRFGMISTEAEAFIREYFGPNKVVEKFFKETHIASIKAQLRIELRAQNANYKPKDLQAMAEARAKEFIGALEELIGKEATKLQSGQISEDIFMRLIEAQEICIAVRRDPVGIEGMVLRSNSKVPLEVLMRVQDRRLIHLWLDSPSARYYDLEVPYSMSSADAEKLIRAHFGNQKEIDQFFRYANFKSLRDELKAGMTNHLDQSQLDRVARETWDGYAKTFDELIANEIENGARGGGYKLKEAQEIAHTLRRGPGGTRPGQRSLHQIGAFYEELFGSKFPKNFAVTEESVLQTQRELNHRIQTWGRFFDSPQQVEALEQAAARIYMLGK